MSDLIVIDGSQGEGGGQILRTSLALSVVTGRPVRFEKIRARRKKPGLMRQHLTAVNAAAELSEAHVEGARIGATELSFAPREVRPGSYTFSIGTAGSATLVLQTVLPPLLQATETSELVIEGGTHNPLAPPFEFLEQSFLPLLEKMGARVTATLERHGFYPAGGGCARFIIEPCAELRPLELMELGESRGRRALAIISALGHGVAERELKQVKKLLGWSDDETSVLDVKNPRGPGNALVLSIESEHVTEVVSEIGAPGISAESVATKAIEAVRQYLKLGVPVGEHLADQLLLPLALAGAGRFRTGPLSRHTETNIDVIEKFLPVRFELERDERLTTVAVTAR